MYEKIYNPKTNRYVNLSSKLGLSIIKNYLQQMGGSVPQVSLANQLSKIVKTKILLKEDLLKEYKWEVAKGIKMDYKDERIKDITTKLMENISFKPSYFCIPEKHLFICEDIRTTYTKYFVV